MLKTTGVLKKLVRLGLSLVILAASVSLAKAAPDAPDAAGDLDLTFAGFGVGGKVITTGVPMPELKRGMALQPDGKIVVAGDTSSGLLVMRYHPNGTLDTTFDGDGKATPDLGQLTRRGTSVAIQADGKIVVAGWADMATLGTNYDFLLVRLTTTGALDTTLDGDGFVTTDFLDEYDVAQAVLIQPDGKIVAAGRAFVGGNYDMAVARYNADGLPDATFGGGDGQVTTDFGGDYEEAYDIALQTDNKLVLVGDHHSGPDDGDFSVARLNSDGTPDASFDGNGVLTTDLGDDETAHAVVIQPDGKIVVAGDSGGHLRWRDI